MLSIDILRPMYLEALAHPDIVGLSIATRPDCFSPEIFSLLDECRQIKPTWIELGLQTVHEHTARFIRRGYPLHVFEQTAHTLHTLNIPVIVHVILGLPGETEADILETIQYLNTQHIQGIKLRAIACIKRNGSGSLSRRTSLAYPDSGRVCRSGHPMHR